MTEFGRLLADLNEVGVRYVLIGAIALIRHGVVRATTDVDVVLSPEEDTLRALRDLIGRWQATRPDGSALPTDAVRPNRSIHLRTPYGLLDALPEREAPLTFEELHARAEVRRVDGTPAPICSLGDLVALKRIGGRSRDLADLDELEAAHGELPDARAD